MTVRIHKEPINLREKLAEVDKPSGIAGEAMLRAETPQEQFNLIGAGRKNLIINGDFQVWQRGTSSSSVGYGSADRWYLNLSGGSATASKVDFANEAGMGSHSYMNLDVTSGNDFLGLQYRMEGRHHLQGKTLTLSFYAKSASPRELTVAGDIFDYSADVNEVLVVTNPTFTPTSSWTKYTFTINVPSGSTLGTEEGSDWTRISISQGTDTSTTAWELDIAQVQLELGSVATPFEHRSYGEELALCQRYYQRHGLSSYAGIATAFQLSSTTTAAGFTFPVQMRSAPSVGSSNLIATNRVSYDVDATPIGSTLSKTNAYIRFNHTAAGAADRANLIAVKNGTSGYLEFSAEL